MLWMLEISNWGIQPCAMAFSFFVIELLGQILWVLGVHHTTGELFWLASLLSYFLKEMSALSLLRQV